MSVIRRELDWKRSISLINFLHVQIQQASPTRRPVRASPAVCLGDLHPRPLQAGGPILLLQFWNCTKLWSQDLSMTTFCRLRWVTFTWCARWRRCSPTSPGGPGWWGWWAGWSPSPRWSAWGWRASLPGRGETSGSWRGPGSWPWRPAGPGLDSNSTMFMSYTIF